jgi:hypothetical protein
LTIAPFHVRPAVANEGKPAAIPSSVLLRRDFSSGAKPYPVASRSNVNALRERCAALFAYRALAIARYNDAQAAS